MKDGLIEFIAFIFVLGVFTLISSSISVMHCSAVGRDLNYKTEWHWFTGCVVEQADGKKVLLKQMRNFE